MAPFIPKQRFMNHEIPFILLAMPQKKPDDGRRLCISLAGIKRRKRNVTDSSPLIRDDVRSRK